MKLGNSVWMIEGLVGKGGLLAHAEIMFLEAKERIMFVGCLQYVCKNFYVSNLNY